MARRIMALGLLCGSLFVAQTADAQGVWLGGPGFGGFGVAPFGFGYPGFYGVGVGSGFSPFGFGSAASFGGYAPATFAYPVAARPVSVARPVVYGSVVVARAPRPAVRMPLNRASRRIWRRGW